jgi:hypothetical protein
MEAKAVVWRSPPLFESFSACCYNPYSLSLCLSFFVLTQDSSSVGTLFLQLVPLYVPHRSHFIHSSSSVKTSHCSLASYRKRSHLSLLLTFPADVWCSICWMYISPKPILSHWFVILITHQILSCSMRFYAYASRYTYNSMSVPCTLLLIYAI